MESRVKREPECPGTNLRRTLEIQEDERRHTPEASCLTDPGMGHL